MPQTSPKSSVDQAEKQPRAGLYARFSPYCNQTLALQLDVMRDYARQRGWNIVVEVEDIGSGAALLQKRDELLAAARRRDIDLVVVWRLERWGRSLADLVGTLQELVSLEVGFVAVREAFELTPMIGRKLAGLLAALTDFELDRVKVGLAQAEKRDRRSSNKINPTRGSKDTRTKTSVKR